MSYTYKKFSFDPDITDGPSDLRASEITTSPITYAVLPGTALTALYSVSGFGYSRVNMFNISTLDTDDVDTYRLAIRDNANSSNTFYLVWGLDMGPHTSLYFFNKYNQLFLNNYDMLLMQFGPASGTGNLRIIQSTTKHIGSSA